MDFDRTESADRRGDKPHGKHVITLELDGEFYSTTDWSLGGFGVDGYQGRLKPGNLVPVTIVLETARETYEHTAFAKIVQNAGQQLAAKFNELGADALDFLTEWQEGHLQRADMPSYA
jgi:hypothetical protein